MITIEYLFECFSPDFNAGTLTWLRRPLHHFNSYAACQRWNGKMSGKPALASFNKKRGYYNGGIAGTTYSRSRVLLAMYLGRWPMSVDHEDRDKSNDKIGNLREGTKRLQTLNRNLRADNTSGATGVTWDKAKKKWLVRDTFSRFICYCTTIEAAVQARRETK